MLTYAGVEEDLVCHLAEAGGGIDLKTLHLLDVLASYFPYCKASVTEAVVAFRTDVC
jgi:hypothetical protein